MIEDREIKSGLSLRDLVAQAVAMGVRAGRGQIEYTGAFSVADDILAETEEVMRHRASTVGIRRQVAQLAQAI